MLPPFYLSAYPATDIDYGLYDLSELEPRAKDFAPDCRKGGRGKEVTHAALPIISEKAHPAPKEILWVAKCANHFNHTQTGL